MNSFYRFSFPSINYARSIFGLASVLLCGHGMFSPVNAQGNAPATNQDDTNKRDAVTVNLTLTGVVKGKGGLIPVNDDWDRELRVAGTGPASLRNKIADKYATELPDSDVGKDDELRYAKVTFEAGQPGGGNKQAGAQGVVKGKWTLNFSGPIRVWRKVISAPVGGGQPVTQWQLTNSGTQSSEVPVTEVLDLQVEGLSPSTTTELMKDSITAKFDLTKGNGGESTLNFTVFKLNLTGNVGEVDEETPGSSVMLNDDNDNNNVYPEATGGIGITPVALGRPFEPVWDKDETATVAGENDLMGFSLSIEPKILTGTVTLKKEGDNIALWQNPLKGSIATAVFADETTGRSYNITDLPLTLYAEGVGKGSSTLTLTYKLFDKEYKDTLKINVVKLEPQQDGKLKIIYEYGKNISFEVSGGAVECSYKWDLDGDGQRGDVNKPYEDTAQIPNITKMKLASYNTSDAIDKINLPQNVGNKRKSYSVSVEIQPSGLILSRTVRVALDGHFGTPLPTQDNAGVQGAVPWNNTTPVVWDMVTPQEQKQYHNDFGINLNINAGNRIQYTSTMKTWYAATHGQWPTPPAVADVEIHFVDVAPYLWIAGWHKEEFDSVISHETVHVHQWVQARKNIVGGVDTNTNSFWRLLKGTSFDNNTGEEAEAYNVYLHDQNIEWLWLAKTTRPGLISGENLEFFSNSYAGAVAALSTLSTNPIPGMTAPLDNKKAIARDFLQKMYQSVPFSEMKRSEYEFSIQPPE